MKQCLAICAIDSIFSIFATSAVLSYKNVECNFVLIGMMNHSMIAVRHQIYLPRLVSLEHLFKI